MPTNTPAPKAPEQGIFYWWAALWKALRFFTRLPGSTIAHPPLLFFFRLAFFHVHFYPNFYPNWFFRCYVFDAAVECFFNI